jgi:hypothetical protein
MAYRFSKRGNYLYIRNDENELLVDGSASLFEITKDLNTDTDYRILKDGIQQLGTKLDISEIVDENGVAFTNFDEWKDENTGFNAASGGSGANPVIAGNGITDNSGTFDLAGNSPLTANIDFNLGNQRAFSMIGSNNAETANRGFQTTPTQTNMFSDNMSILLNSSGFRFLNFTDLPAVNDVWTANSITGQGYWATPVLQNTVLTLTDHPIISDKLIEILPAPGADRIYEPVSLLISKNLTTKYSSSISYDIRLGTDSIISGQDQLFLKSLVGVSLDRLSIDNDKYGKSMTSQINQPLTLKFNTTATGGVGTIKIFVIYQILSL